MPTFYNQKHATDLSEVLCRQNYDRVYRVVFSILKDPEVSEEAVQEAFVKAIMKMHQLKDKNKFVVWVISIAINEGKKLFNKRKKNKVLSLDDLNVTEPLAKNDFEAVDLKYEMEKLMNRLSPTEYEILILKYYSDMTIEQISELLNISISNTKTRLSRARSSFRSLFERDSTDGSLKGGSLECHYPKKN